MWSGRGERSEKWERLWRAESMVRDSSDGGVILIHPLIYLYDKLINIAYSELKNSICFLLSPKRVKYETIKIWSDLFLRGMYNAHPFNTAFSPSYSYIYPRVRVRVWTRGRGPCPCLPCSCQICNSCNVPIIKCHRWKMTLSLANYKKKQKCYL